MRTLVEDIAKRAGTVAHTLRLHRESVADFNSVDMLDLDTIESLAEAGPEALRDRLLAPDVALMHLPAVHVEAQAGERFSGGQAVAAAGATGNGMARVYAGNQQFLGVGELTGNDTVAPRRVFQLAGKNP